MMVRRHDDGTVAYIRTLLFIEHNTVGSGIEIFGRIIIICRPL
jgi:hypothetical protein